MHRQTQGHLEWCHGILASTFIYTKQHEGPTLLKLLAPVVLLMELQVSTAMRSNKK